jgi:7-keto-8-aminopelargonate synthetase-like enzyme
VRAGCACVLQGAKLSRARVRWFKHNDMRSLEDLLKQIEAEERAERCGGFTHTRTACVCFS